MNNINNLNNLKEGLSYSLKTIVTKNDLAVNLKSGSLEVLGTPKLIALMEEACTYIAGPNINKENTTVGTKITIEHIAPSFINAKITINATLTKIDNRKLYFEIEAFDDDKKIGFASAERVIVNINKFMTKK